MHEGSNLKYLIPISLTIGLIIFSTFLPRNTVYLALSASLILSTIILTKDFCKLLYSFKYIIILVGFFLVYFSLRFGFTTILLNFSNDGLILSLVGFFQFFLLLKHFNINIYKIFLTFFYSTVNFICSIAVLQFFGLLKTTQRSIADLYLLAPLYRSTAFFPHSTALSLWALGLCFLLLSLPIISRIQLYTHVFTSILVSVTLVATQGRAAFLLALISCFGIILNNFKKDIKFSFKKQNYKYFLTMFFITTLSLYYFINSSSRFSDFLNLKAKHSQRLQELHLGYQIFKQNPLGLGPENISKAAEEIRNSELFFNQKNWIFTEWRGIHNGYLHYASVWGVPGLLFLLLCLLSPIIFFGTSWHSVLFTIVLASYLMTDNIYYREVSTLYGLIFAFTSYRSKLLDQTKLKIVFKETHFSFLFIIILLSASTLLTLRFLQIEKSEAVHLVIDNPSDQIFEINLNTKHNIQLLPNDYAMYSFKPNQIVDVQIANILNSNKKNKLIFSAKKRFTDLNYDSYFFTTQDDNYSLLYFKKQTPQDQFLQQLYENTTLVKSYEIQGVPEAAVKGGTHLNEESTRDFKYLSVVTKQPIFARDHFDRDGKYMCYEPAHYNKWQQMYFNPCLMSNYPDYTLKSIAEVFSGPH